LLGSSGGVLGIADGDGVACLEGTGLGFDDGGGVSGGVGCVEGVPMGFIDGSKEGLTDEGVALGLLLGIRVGGLGDSEGAMIGNTGFLVSVIVGLLVGPEGLEVGALDGPV
jgi:hypothetical protein